MGTYSTAPVHTVLYSTVDVLAVGVVEVAVEVAVEVEELKWRSMEWSSSFYCTVCTILYTPYYTVLYALYCTV